MKLLSLFIIVSVANASPPEIDEVVTKADVQLLQAGLSVETKLEDNAKTATAKQECASLDDPRNAACKLHVEWAYSRGKNAGGADTWYSQMMRNSGVTYMDATLDDFHRLFFCGSMDPHPPCETAPCSCTNPPCDTCKMKTARWTEYRGGACRDQYGREYDSYNKSGHTGDWADVEECKQECLRVDKATCAGVNWRTGNCKLRINKDASTWVTSGSNAKLFDAGWERNWDGGSGKGTPKSASGGNTGFSCYARETVGEVMG